MDLHDIPPWLLAAAIFLARVGDVSLATIRMILVFRGHKIVAAMIGFVEILIWIFAAGQVLHNLDRWYLVVAYAGGFATGNAVGVWLESRIALGVELLRVLSEDTGLALARQLRGDGHAVVELAGHGEGGAPVEVLFVVESRRRMPSLLEKVLKIDPGAVCTVSDVRRHHALARAAVPSVVRTR